MHLEGYTRSADLRILQILSKGKARLGLRVDVGLFLGRGFLTWMRRPTHPSRSLEITPNKPRKDRSHKDVAIVMQGPVKERRKFTLETLAWYKKAFPGAQLILSTWNGQDPAVHRACAELGVTLITSEPMSGGQTRNLWRQVTTTLAGINAAKKLGVTFVLKVRTDQRIYSAEALDYMKAVIHFHPPKTNPMVRGRIVFPSVNSFVNRPQGASDFLQFGHLSDMEVFWTSVGNYPLEEGLSIEQMLTGSYLLAIGYRAEGLFTHATYSLAMRQVLAFIDASAIDFFWYKYTMREHVYERYGASAKQAVTNSYWLARQVED